MNTKTQTNISHKSIQLPQTGRGRGLFTVSWFLHGAAPQLNFDQRHYQFTEVRHVHA